MLIAEIGNNHFGNIQNAKDHIKAAKDSGADLVKLQAVDFDTFKGGSMPEDFYKACALSVQSYAKLVQYGEKVGIDVFFSIFGQRYEGLRDFCKYMKYSATQYADFDDKKNVFVSFPQNIGFFPQIRNAKPMYASPYMANDPSLDHIKKYSKIFKRKFGYSDHTIGVGWCIRAITDYKLPCLEKHFTLEKSKSYKGFVFRDTIHGATPKEFEQLAQHYHAKRGRHD